MDGINYKTTDLAKWGPGTGAGTDGRLTEVQADLNFWELYTRLKNLEDNPPEAVSISSVTVIGSQFQLNMSDASVLGPYDLPIATFRLLGDWVNDYPYEQLDMITVPHAGLYMVNIAHTSAASPALFDPTAIDEDSGSPTFGDPLFTLIFGEDAYIYDMGFFYPGTPGLGIQSGEAMFGHVFARDVKLEATLPGSVARVRVATTSAMSFDILKNEDVIGTLDFGTADLEGAFTFVDDVEFVSGDLLSIIAPATSDATAKELRVTIRGLRQDF